MNKSNSNSNNNTVSDYRYDDLFAKQGSNIFLQNQLDILSSKPVCLRSIDIEKEFKLFLSQHIRKHKKSDTIRNTKMMNSEKEDIIKNVNNSTNNNNNNNNPFTSINTSTDTNEKEDEKLIKLDPKEYKKFVDLTAGKVDDKKIVVKLDYNDEENNKLKEEKLLDTCTEINVIHTNNNNNSSSSDIISRDTAASTNTASLSILPDNEKDDKKEDTNCQDEYKTEIKHNLITKEQIEIEYNIFARAKLSCDGRYYTVKLIINDDLQNDEYEDIEIDIIQLKVSEENMSKSVGIIQKIVFEPHLFIDKFDEILCKDTRYIITFTVNSNNEQMSRFKYYNKKFTEL